MFRCATILNYLKTHYNGRKILLLLKIQLLPYFLRKYILFSPSLFLHFPYESLRGEVWLGSPCSCTLASLYYYTPIFLQLTMKKNDLVIGLQAPIKSITTSSMTQGVSWLVTRQIWLCYAAKGGSTQGWEERDGEWNLRFDSVMSGNSSGIWFQHIPPYPPP